VNSIKLPTKSADEEGGEGHRGEPGTIPPRLLRGYRWPRMAERVAGPTTAAGMRVREKKPAGAGVMGGRERGRGCYAGYVHN